MKRIGLALAAVALVACNDNGDDVDDGSHRPAPMAASTAALPAYPPGPYDVAKGAIIPDERFSGFVDAKADASKLDVIAFSDFYNPHHGDASYKPASADEDDRLYPPGSRYGAGRPKPSALLVDIASVWCGPCNQEAKSEFPGLYARYKPCGGEILFQLVESASPGSPATEKNLRDWTKNYKVDYPATIDPSRQLSALYSSNSFPDAAIVDTRSMRIVEISQGVPDDAFWATYESLLDAACLAPK
jgi:hypothetical protein